jgi:hypothetical protein
MKINIINQQTKDRACELVQALDEGKRMIVEIRPYKEIRSTAQNSLYWVFVTQLAGEHGLTKEEVHEDLKKRLLSPIYQRDLPWFSELISSVRAVWSSGDKDLAQQMFDRIMKLVSTTMASVEQFSEYLEDIERDSLGRGIYLMRPEDLYRDAMGR